MFGVDTSEFIIVAVVALLFIGPKELPAAMRTVGRWVGKLRGMARHFSSGIEAVIRDAELEEMERKWREENERIMREFPAVGEGLTREADQVAEVRAYLDQPAPAAEPAEELPPEKRELP